MPPRFNDIEAMLALYYQSNINKNPVLAEDPV
jgi:hypothetical protein